MEEILKFRVQLRESAHEQQYSREALQRSFAQPVLFFGQGERSVQRSTPGLLHTRKFALPAPADGPTHQRTLA